MTQFDDVKRQWDDYIVAELKERLSGSVVDANGCWILRHGLDKDGYSRVRHPRLETGRIKGHRLSYLLHKGPIADGLIVMHTCDVRACVNPDHLVLGTNLDNILDRTLKGRSRSWRQRLTPEQVVAIRQERVATGRTLSSIGDEYGVGKSAIWRITSGTGWRNAR